MMKSNLGNVKGFTLIEVISVVIVLGILAFFAFWAIGHFIAKFDEIEKYSSLQEQAYIAVNQMKRGVVVGQNGNYEFYGIAGSAEVQLGYTSPGNPIPSNEITCFMGSDTGVPTNDRVKFYFDDNVVKYQYYYGTQVKTGVLFPKVADEGIEVTKLEFKYLHKNSNETINSKAFVYLTLEAKIETENKKTPPRTVTYKTGISIGG
ncbi:MAG: hypothetical protein CSB55_04015 [Candidatus Cloacimonadota bacterium]|nr:MAG: hypothetical protein CSB55_04015 [Candidatus Cloacimonadota bacterium]